MNGQMLNYLPGEGVLRIREFCGLNHEFQVAELDFPPLPETVRQCAGSRRTAAVSRCSAHSRIPGADFWRSRSLRMNSST